MIVKERFNVSEQVLSAISYDIFKAVNWTDMTE